MSVLNQQILTNLDHLLKHYQDDTGAKEALLSIREQLLQPNTPSNTLTQNLNTAFHLLVDCKTDNARLQAETVDLREQLHACKHVMQDSQATFAIRQVYRAVNEKLMRKFACELGVPVQTLWKSWISNMGGLGRLPAAKQTWKHFAARYGIDDEPRGLWDQLRDGKQLFGTLKHEGRGLQFTVAEMRQVADKVFVGDTEAYKPAFLHFLNINEQLSNEMQTGLFEY